MRLHSGERQAAGTRSRATARKGAELVVFTFMGCFSASPVQQTPIPVPDRLDYSGLQMGIERRNCEGPCVLYTATVNGKGDVSFIGGSGMLTPGHHRSQISQQAVRELVEAFRRADYFNLKDRYWHLITDAQGIRTWIEVNGRKKSVDDYGGLAGTPAVLKELENSFDQIAGTEKWRRGNKDTLSSLLAEHWDFRSLSEDNLNLYANVMARGPEDLVDFILGQPHLPAMLLSQALEGATGAGKVLLARRLIAKGANPDPLVNLPYKRTLLMDAAASGSLEMVKEILQYHPDVNAADYDGRTVLNYISHPNFGVNESLEILKLLIAAGADVNSVDNRGETPIFHVCGRSPEFVRVLKRAGANLNFRDVNGETPLMSCWDLVTVRALIDAGANLKIRNGKGLTAAETALDEGMVEKAKLIEAAEKAAERH